MKTEEELEIETEEEAELARLIHEQGLDDLDPAPAEEWSDFFSSGYKQIWGDEGPVEGCYRKDTSVDDE